MNEKRQDKLLDANIDLTKIILETNNRILDMNQLVLTELLTARHYLDTSKVEMKFKDSE